MMASSSSLLRLPHGRMLLELHRSVATTKSIAEGADHWEVLLLLVTSLRPSVSHDSGRGASALLHGSW